MKLKDIRDTFKNDYLDITENDQLSVGRDLLEDVVEGVDTLQDINKRLELLRRINCLGELDIRKAFKGDSNLDHVLSKYEKCREECGSYGNFKFIFDLDSDYGARLFQSIGYHGVDLGEKE